MNRRVKQEWQQFCEIALMEQRVPRGLEVVTVSARLFFRQWRRRDEGNFRVVVEKALGDALTNGHWLPDDTPDHYRFGALECLVDKEGPPRTELTLVLEG